MAILDSLMTLKSDDSVSSW